MLRNPNKKFKPVALLADPKLADIPYLTTPWSDAPYPVVSVPGDTRILAMSVKPGREPSGQVLVTKWSRLKGVETHHEFTVVRGQVVDFADVTSTVPAAAGVPGFNQGMMGPRGGMGPPLQPGPGGAMPKEFGPGTPGRDPTGRMPGPGRDATGRMTGPGVGPPTPPVRGGGRGGPAMPVRPGAFPMGGPAGLSTTMKVDYFTHAIVVDFRGGERLHGKKVNSLGLAAPGEILLLDSDGNLVVRDELDDKTECDRLTRDDHAAGGEELRRPGDVHGGAAGHGGALDRLFNRDEPPRRRPRPGGEH